MSTPTPNAENERLAALQQCSVLDTAPEPVFDDLVQLAAELCETPIALISLVDRDRQWFKANHGMPHTHTPRCVAFCGHAILTPDAPFVVPDATIDPRFRDNPLVTGESGIRFYAGVPLATSEHLAIGALCVMDTRPRTLTDAQLFNLKRLARQASVLLELRRTLTLVTQARDTAEAASRAKTAFLATVSQEVRSPLTTILGHADLLADSSATDYDRAEGVQTIRRNSAHLVRILGDLTDLSHIEAGKAAVELESVPLRGILDDVVALLSPSAAAKGLTLSVRTEASAPRSIRTDAVRLRQILLNLVTNAVRFTTRGGVQVIARGMTPTHGDDTGLRIDVIDSGSGIPAAELSELFKPFSNLRHPGASPGLGAGLGLTIARELTRLLRGELQIDSTPSVGSRFSVILPGCVTEPTILPVEMTPSIEPAHVLVPAPAQRHHPIGRVLVVDDGPDNRRLIGHFLRLAGAQVSFAEDGAECIRRFTVNATLDAELRDDPPADIILMDVEMPIMDGLTAASTLRAKGYRRPIIALTARASAADRTDCMAAGCNAFLTKPVDRHQLIDCCARLAVAKNTTLAA